MFLAGRPGQYTDVDSYVFAGCDAVAVLSATALLSGWFGGYALTAWPYAI